MFEMADAGSHHGYVMRIAVVNGLLIAYRTAGLYNGCNPCFVSNLYAVGKREECIRGHHGAIEIESE